MTENAVEAREFSAGVTFKVSINRRVQKELGLSDEDVNRLIVGRPVAQKMWTTEPKTAQARKASRPQKPKKRTDVIQTTQGDTVTL